MHEQPILRPKWTTDLFYALFNGAVIRVGLAAIIFAAVKTPLGPLNWLIATPQFHHWHHANHVEAYDKNFAGQLSIIDVVFGSLHMPKSLPTRYGTNDPVPHGYLRQLAFPVRRGRKAKAAAGQSPQPAPAK